MTRYCKFYADTFDGKRCVFFPPEKFILRPEWVNEGRGCEVLAWYLQVRMRFGPGPDPRPAGPASVTPRKTGGLLDYIT